MNYHELKDYLKKNPYCFRPSKERQDEFNQKIIAFEGRDINFIDGTPKIKPKYE